MRSTMHCDRHRRPNSHELGVAPRQHATNNVANGTYTQKHSERINIKELQQISIFY